MRPKREKFTELFFEKYQVQFILFFYTIFFSIFFSIMLWGCLEHQTQAEVDHRTFFREVSGE